MLDDFDRAPVNGIELEGDSADIYAEDTFRYFLGLERKRAERSGQSFLLVLVEFEPRPGQPADLDNRSAAELFAQLLPCIRETDFVGWYQTRRIAGTVLTQFGDSSIAEIADVITRRISNALDSGISPAVRSRLQVRVHQLPAYAGRGR